MDIEGLSEKEIEQRASFWDILGQVGKEFGVPYTTRYRRMERDSFPGDQINTYVKKAEDMGLDLTHDQFDLHCVKLNRGRKPA